MKKPRVIVDVIGGVANPWKIPKGVEVEVRDYDNGQDADKGFYKTDDNGARYCRAVYTKGD